MCHASRPPQTATSAASNHDRQASPSASSAQARATATSSSPHVTSTTETRPSLRATKAVTVMATTQVSRTTPATVAMSSVTRAGSPLQHDLLDVEVTGGEPGSGVLQVEVPHPLEGRVEAELADPVARGPERVVPAAQRLGVVAAERQ